MELEFIEAESSDCSSTVTDYLLRGQSSSGSSAHSDALPTPPILAQSARTSMSPRFSKVSSFRHVTRRRSSCRTSMEAEDKREAIARRLASINSKLFSPVRDAALMRDLAKLQARLKSSSNDNPSVGDAAIQDGESLVGSNKPRKSLPSTFSASSPTSVGPKGFHFVTDRISTAQSRQDRLAGLVQEQIKGLKSANINVEVTTEVAVDSLVNAATEMQRVIDRADRKRDRASQPDSTHKTQPSVSAPRLRSAEREYRRLVQVIASTHAQKANEAKQIPSESSDEEAYLAEVILDEELRLCDEQQRRIAIDKLRQPELEDLRVKHQKAASEGRPLYVKSADEPDDESISSSASRPPDARRLDFESAVRPPGPPVAPLYSNLPKWILEPNEEELSTYIEQTLKQKREMRDRMEQRRRVQEASEGRPSSRQVGRYNRFVKCPVIDQGSSPSRPPMRTPTPPTTKESIDPKATSVERMRRAVQLYKAAYESAQYFKCVRPSPPANTSASTKEKKCKSGRLSPPRNLSPERYRSASKPPKPLAASPPAKANTSVRPTPRRQHAQSLLKQAYDSGQSETRKSEPKKLRKQAPKQLQGGEDTADPMVAGDPGVESTPPKPTTPPPMRDAEAEMDAPVAKFVEALIDTALSSTVTSALEGMGADDHPTQPKEVTVPHLMQLEPAISDTQAEEALSEPLLTVNLRTETTAPGAMSVTNRPPDSTSNSPFEKALSASNSPIQDALLALSHCDNDRRVSVATQQFGDSDADPQEPLSLSPPQAPQPELPVLIAPSPKVFIVPDDLSVSHVVLIQRVGRGYLGCVLQQHRQLGVNATSCIVSVLDAVNTLLPVIAGLQGSVAAYGRDFGGGMSTSFGIGTFGFSTTSAAGKPLVPTGIGSAASDPLSSPSKGLAPISQSSHAAISGSTVPLYGFQSLDMDMATRRTVLALLPDLSGGTLCAVGHRLSQTNMMASPRTTPIPTDDSRSMSPNNMLTSYTNFGGTIGGNFSITGGAAMPPFAMSPLSPYRDRSMPAGHPPMSSTMSPPQSPRHFASPHSFRKAPFRPDATMIEALMSAPTSYATAPPAARLHNDELMSTEASVDFGLGGGTLEEDTPVPPAEDKATCAAQLIRLRRVQLAEERLAARENQLLPQASQASALGEMSDTNSNLYDQCKRLVEAVLHAATRIARAVYTRHGYNHFVQHSLLTIGGAIGLSASLDGLAALKATEPFDINEVSKAARHLVASCGRRTLAVLRAAVALAPLAHVSLGYKARNRLRLRSRAMAEAELEMKRWDTMDTKALHIQRIVRGWLGRRRAKKVRREKEIWATYSQ